MKYTGITAADDSGRRQSVPAIGRADLRIASTDRVDALSAAKSIVAFRRKRDGLLGDALFSDPAWDILLDLYIAHHEGSRVSVSSCCIGSSTPPTTALRWITILEKRGLVRRQADDLDRRRSYLQLTTATYDALHQLLEEHVCGIER